MIIVVIVAIVGVDAVCRGMREHMPARPEVLLLREMKRHVEQAQPQREHHEQNR